MHTNVAAVESGQQCDVCGECAATAGGLSCRHGFCPKCFDSYVNGSIRELHTSVRCCICGTINDLVKEISGDSPKETYGRQGNNQLYLPVGISACSRESSEVVVVDQETQRIYVYKDDGDTGKICEDFGYVHNTQPTGDVTQTSSGQLAIPFRDDKYDFVSYFSIHGHFLGSSFVNFDVEHRPDIQGITCDLLKDVIYLTDANNCCVHVLNNSSRTQAAVINLEPVRFETSPVPKGITTTPTGDLLITDIANHCLKIYSSSGQFKEKIGTRGQRPGQFDLPTSVCLTSEGFIVVADRGNQRVQLLDRNGKFLRYIVRFKSGFDVYMAPEAICQAKEGTVAVLMSRTRAATVGEVREYRYSHGV